MITECIKITNSDHAHGEAKGGFSETRRSEQRERTREDQVFKMDTISRKNYNLTIMCTSPHNVHVAACIYVHVSILEIKPYVASTHGN